jgi:chromosome segregation ATPase
MDAETIRERLTLVEQVEQAIHKAHAIRNTDDQRTLWTLYLREFAPVISPLLTESSAAKDREIARLTAERHAASPALAAADRYVDDLHAKLVRLSAEATALRQEWDRTNELYQLSLHELSKAEQELDALKAELEEARLAVKWHDSEVLQLEREAAARSRGEA